MVNVIGIDPSLSCTALTHALGPLDHPEIRSANIASSPKDFAHAAERLYSLRSRLMAQLELSARELEPGWVFVEGYAFGARNKREALGEWGGLIRLTAFERGWRVVVVAPTALKAFVTGKGNAEKSLMLREVFKRWQYDASDDNDADAHALMRLGLEFLRWRSGEHVTQATIKVVAKLAVWEGMRAAC